MHLRRVHASKCIPRLLPPLGLSSLNTSYVRMPPTAAETCSDLANLNDNDEDQMYLDSDRHVKRCGVTTEVLRCGLLLSCTRVIIQSSHHASNCEDCIKPNRGHHVNLPLAREGMTCTNTMLDQVAVTHKSQQLKSRRRSTKFVILYQRQLHQWRQ